MSVNLDAGKPITALQADHYLKKYVAIRENLQKSSMPLKKPTTGTQSQQREIDDVNIFYQSDVNAFIFSKELIERFFSSEKKADYLMVILAAKYEGKEQGNPTVVVAGVNKKSDGKGYKSLSIPYAADEQPPTGTLVEFPPDNEITPVVLNVIL